MSSETKASQHTPQDFLYVPAAAAADWTHLAHHFARFGVLNEVSMPQMVYMLVSAAVQAACVGCSWEVRDADREARFDTLDDQQ